MDCARSTNGCNSVVNDEMAASPSPVSDSHHRTQKSGLRVNFREKAPGEGNEKREKFLTAKYGSHQMSLIRKRLAVEMWLYDDVQRLSKLADVTREIDVDLDELLDMDSDSERQSHVKNLMLDIFDRSPQEGQKFLKDLLEKMKTL